MRQSKPLLLVENDHMDAVTMGRALKDLNILNPLIHFDDGQKALDHLKTADKSKPCIILLDLNMPKMNGFEFLKAIKADSVLKTIPVIVLSGSDENRDITESFKLSAAGYIIKPVDYKKLLETIRIVHLYWTLSELSNGD